MHTGSACSVTPPSDPPCRQEAPSHPGDVLSYALTTDPESCKFEFEESHMCEGLAARFCALPILSAMRARLRLRWGHILCMRKAVLGVKSCKIVGVMELS